MPSSRDVKSVSVVLKQAKSSSDRSSINQWIDSIMDNNVLSYNGIVQYILSSEHERSIMLMQVVSKLNEGPG